MTTATAPPREIEYTRPYLYPKQQAAIFDPARFSWIEASTKSGKTVGCIAWIVEQALVNGPEGGNHWWVAPIYSQSRIAFRRLKRMLPRESYRSNDAESFITLRPNDAVIWFKSGDNPDALFGEDVYSVVIDEASRCKDGVWEAVLSTLTATEGRARIIGNVKGRRNWAYKQARNRGPDDAFHRITAQDAIDAGVLTEVAVDTARSKLTEAAAQQLFDAIPADDEGNPFGIEHIQACLMDEVSTDRPVVWGWDLAKYTDWTVGIGLDGMGRLAGFSRFRRSWEETINTIRATTGSALAVVDATGVGDPIVERLTRAGLWIEPEIFTSPRKQQLMEGLAVAIQSGAVGFTAGPDNVILDELESFEYALIPSGVRYSAPDGMHDDCVVALSLAVSQLRKVGGPPPIPRYMEETRRSGTPRRSRMKERF